MAIEPRVCMVCQIKVKRKYIVNKLPLKDNHYIQENIAWMLVYDQKRCARLWHLEMVLLGRPLSNWFRKLTYGGNGLRGSISSTEDIFDRVLSFLGYYTIV